jgi:hypothetical protein
MYHATMAKPHELCDMSDEKFYLDGGITNGADWYSVKGGMQDFNYLSSNCFEITLELGCEKFPPASDLPQYWDDNRAALLNFIWQTHTGVKGIITTEDEKPISNAVIRVLDLITGQYINHDITSAHDGDYWRLLNDGVYEIEACAEPDFECVAKQVRVVNEPQTSALEVSFVLPAAGTSQNSAAALLRALEREESY